MWTTLGISGSYGFVEAIGTFVRVRVDASDGIVRWASTGVEIPELPTRWINSGLMTRLVADSGKRTRMDAVAHTIIADVAHAWKTELTLEDICAKFDVDVNVILAAYAEEDAPFAEVA